MRQTQCAGAGTRSRIFERREQCFKPIERLTQRRLALNLLGDGPAKKGEVGQIVVVRRHVVLRMHAAPPGRVMCAGADGMMLDAVG